MDEEWRDVVGHPEYRVSNLGRIENRKSGRILVLSKNQQGHLKVNLSSGGSSKTRHVNHIVADAWLEAPKREDHISLIHKDGDKTNCRADNLAWRPRHYAIRYHSQFHSAMWAESKVAVMDIKTGRVYAPAQLAALEYGLVLSEILVTAHNRTFVWPTYQQFRIVDENG